MLRNTIETETTPEIEAARGDCNLEITEAIDRFAKRTGLIPTGVGLDVIDASSREGPNYILAVNLDRRYIRLGLSRDTPQN